MDVEFPLKKQVEIHWGDEEGFPVIITFQRHNEITVRCHGSFKGMPFNEKVGRYHTLTIFANGKVELHPDHLQSTTPRDQERLVIRHHAAGISFEVLPAWHYQADRPG